MRRMSTIASISRRDEYVPKPLVRSPVDRFQQDAEESVEMESAETDRTLLVNAGGGER